MVIPTVSVPNVQMPPQPQASDFAGVPTETSILARMPFRVVPSTPSTPEVYNNTRTTQSVGDKTSAAEVSASSQSSAPVVAGPNARQSGARGGQLGNNLSTLFLAQVIAQGDQVTISEPVIDSPESPILENDVIDYFSNIKYYPSLAAKPEPAPQGTSAVVKWEPPPKPVDAPKVEMQPEQLEMRLELPEKISRVGNADVAAVTTSKPAAPPPPAPIEAPAVKQAQPRVRTDGSLLRSGGVDAYNNTFSRNLMNLDDGSDTTSAPIRLTI